MGALKCIEIVVLVFFSESLKLKLISDTIGIIYFILLMGTFRFMTLYSFNNTRNWSLCLKACMNVIELNSD